MSKLIFPSETYLARGAVMPQSLKRREEGCVPGRFYTRYNVHIQLVAIYLHPSSRK